MRQGAMNIPVSELMALLPAQLLSGCSSTRISGFASLKEAVPGDLSFFSDMRYRRLLDQTQATAVLIPMDWTAFPANVVCLGVQNPSVAFETVTERFGLQPATFTPGVHASAIVGNCVNTNLDKVKIGPHAVIEDGVHIGDGSEVGAGCFIGRGASLGADCRLYANSTVHEGSQLGDRVVLHSSSVIGADGFGYVFKDGRHRKVRQSGIVQLDNDVEVGASSTVDRARFGRTWIGEGTKIDNQVQIAHNVVVGKHCVIVAGCGIAGSSRMGDYVIIAAQCGVAGHVSIGSQCTLAARTVVTKDIPAGSGAYMGFPAAPVMDERRRIVASRQLPALMERVRNLEQTQKSVTQ
ncbi:UDP-3-O-(3-hydroxymyristoyl)glucosamine N-acyltransferase [Verrucomicrobium sp. BvORR106]|uniref:UDP-3-O-(3-hydroxymyristoyl)glucosamine N-acyltransferase n=1 Tax=Verrucomicrobium sp. BvORR106 TaxID=1403819 RepID=UPI0009DF2F4D|nr:UDP-3-O-(3-hydroxymyristoyl)glucosamine N-acyltransferase [Verrucomicrobium sp. BvORR106]